ncbi:phBC6A51 family helix-turn-helix protein [Thermoflavimicrobium dichotomicum]|uniref:Helix-turn-helix of insertion element transposase n=1 Tax=Thermoflavimicrobium dichotomicum TaxID=46223 RepID=A0A1I3UMJ1_9BACL|nr:phBC6A51 family helix-turn-helix protein [Thermoflavimicrobium dichotomicum]SFJ83021.1 Helix-turn-helix of insertion element transposase [Thermoflavimicrobium dichotomicum]
MLSQKQIKAARLLAEGDLQQREIARQLNITPQTLSRWKQNEKFMELVEEFLNEIVQEQYSDIKRLSRKATKTLDKLLNARSEMVRYHVAKDILDRVGLKPIETPQNNNTNIMINIKGSRDQ